MNGNSEKGYKIGQVSRMLDLPTSVLRYWEMEFEQLDPGKSEGGQRIYHDKDIAVLKLIRSLLYEERFTISGARRELARRLDGAEPLPAPAPATDDPSVLGNVRRELNAILEMLR